MTLEGSKLDNDLSRKFSNDPDYLMKYTASLNAFFKVERAVGLGDLSSIEPPEHLPPEIEAVFREGAKCLAIGCPNAAATMFRLCLDLASMPLLPNAQDAAVAQPNAFQRRNLGPRLAWLFDQGVLPPDLKGLATSVKDEGNDGAHAGTLKMADAEDLLDFAVAFLERHFTEPKRIELAEARRKARRKA